MEMQFNMGKDKHISIDVSLIEHGDLIRETIYVYPR